MVTYPNPNFFIFQKRVAVVKSATGKRAFAGQVAGNHASWKPAASSYHVAFVSVGRFSYLVLGSYVLGSYD